ncbi:MAG: FAD-dependent oxidoreductase [Lachnospiraceae bacterium]|nr:FAD-dependent oxidoreductase [Lachnospiraceae bacterium]
MILIQQLKLRVPCDEQAIKSKAAKALMIKEEEILKLEILRESLDCRKKPEIFAVITAQVKVKGEEKVLKRALGNKKAKEQFSISDVKEYVFPTPVAELGENAKRPVIIGAGPAGLFCAYYLARAGLRPLLLERGRDVERRKQDVETFWKTGKLDPSSNVQFGEGGAGTFSDGKLNTLVKDKDGRNRAVLKTFVQFGAKKSILYDAKPHVGTDELSKIVANLREEILRLGGEIRFESQMTDLVIKDERLTGIVVNEKETIECDHLVLAIGHSARDTFFMLHRHQVPMEAKPFAVGFRVEHPQEMVNESQYGRKDPGALGAAPYKVTAKASNGRGVYSFCMCPGGYVVNASSEEGRLAVNGMSYSGRDGKNANSAIIVSVTPEDYPGEGPLAGIFFQRDLEEKAYRLGQGKIPVQRYGEYRIGIMTESRKTIPDERIVDRSGQWESSLNFIENMIIEPCCKGEYLWTELRGLLPEECEKAFVEGMSQFGRQIKDFDRDDCILSGVESRTSSPVRIVRDEHLCSQISGIYPCGEGAGYAGGITSAAMDGLRVGEEIFKRLTKS